MKVIIDKRKNFDHIVTDEYREVYDEYEGNPAYDHITSIIDEYISELNSKGFELTDQDKMNDIEAATNFKIGEYEFSLDDYTYYITIEE